MPDVEQRERVLVHQVHPAKLAVDIGTSLVSNVLLWRHQIVAGLVVRYLFPVLASVLVLRFADLESLASSPAGRYVVKHMPPQAMAVRLAGDTLMAAGAWKNRPQWLVVGAVLIALGWLHGARPALSWPHAAAMR